MLLMGRKDYRALSEEELAREKARLLAQFKEEEDANDGTDQGTD